MCARIYIHAYTQVPAQSGIYAQIMLLACVIYFARLFESIYSNDVSGFWICLEFLVALSAFWALRRGHRARQPSGPAWSIADEAERTRLRGTARPSAASPTASAGPLGLFCSSPARRSIAAPLDSDCQPGSVSSPSVWEGRYQALQAERESAQLRVDRVLAKR